MAEETVIPEVTAAPDEPERPAVDASLIQVLINISASLKRIEEHLLPKDKEEEVPSTILHKILEGAVKQIKRFVDVQAEGVACIVK
jgi:hypothetical protein